VSHNFDVAVFVKEPQNSQHSVFNPLPLLFKALLHGQKDRGFFSGHLIYVLKQERFRTFKLAWDI
jgi:hypothetical protein